MPSQHRLRELFDYREGHLYPKLSQKGRPKGKPVGGIGHRGYRFTGLDYKQLAVHRLIWVWHYGGIPPTMQIDHIDRDRLNNRIENLRLVNASQNARNRCVSPNHPSGVPGVRKCKDKWYATITLGTFDRLEDAVAIRYAAEAFIANYPN